MTIQDNKNKIFKEFVLVSDGVETFTVKRQMKQSDISEAKKISFWNEENQNYENPSGIDAPFKKLYDNNFIWADTNPSDEAKFGASTLCGALLKEIATEHANSDEYKELSNQFHEIFNNPNSSLRKKISSIEGKIQEVITDQFGSADIRFEFDEVEIESFFKTVNIIIDDGTSVPLGEKGHGMQRAVALALLQVYAESVSKSAGESVSKPFFLFIDEPEICMHPLGQIKLLDALVQISKTRQVFIATHSPFMISSPSINNAGLFIFNKVNEVNNVISSKMAPFFPWSPSWSEIIYKAYKLPTIELHNELYGYIQSVSEKVKLDDFDKWLVRNGLEKDCTWIKDKDNSSQKVTLQTFVRNHIHHPDNQLMKSKPYTQEELCQSIEEMVALLPKKQ